jgi:hypothetical protein
MIAETAYNRSYRFIVNLSVVKRADLQKIREGYLLFYELLPDTQTAFDVPGTRMMGKPLGIVPDAISATADPEGHPVIVGGIINAITVTALVPPGGIPATILPNVLTHSIVPGCNCPIGVLTTPWSCRSNAVTVGHGLGIGVGVGAASLHLPVLRHWFS